jgi:hypothetical protein
MDSSRQQPSSKKPIQRKERSLQEILDEFSPLTDITYEPVKVEDRREAYAHLPPTLFFTPDLFDLITKNTNEYTRFHSNNANY